MRVSSITTYQMPSNVQHKKNNRTVTGNLRKNEPNPASAPSFKGNLFKITGLIAGAAAVVVFAPAVAAMGLAGLGAAPGAILGALLDEKLEEKDKKDGGDS